MGVTWDGSGVRPVLPNPLLDRLGFPDFAHAEHDHGGREIGARDELLHALPADAEACADLGGSHQVVHGGQHSRHATCRLTSGQVPGKTSHTPRVI